MKILINAITGKMGGAQVIINSFIENINSEDENEYHFLVYTNAIKKGILNKIGKNIFINESNKGDMPPIKKYLWYQFIFPRYIKKNGFEYLINLSNYGPVRPGCKQILLLHNAIHVSKEMRGILSLKSKIKFMLQDYVLKQSLQGSDTLVVQTLYMKNGVVNKFKFDPHRIIVIPSCPEEILSKTTEETLEKKVKDFIKGNDNILTNISLYGRHKNLERLMGSLKYLKSINKLNFKLILTIDEKEGKEAKNLLNLITEYQLEEYVLSVGNIKRENIHQLLSRTKIFIFPSYAESFGIPLVEAMKFGLPIIAADLDYAHDVCGAAAMYFKYDDEKDLAEKIVTLIENSEVEEELRKESLKQSEKYDDKKIVGRYLQLLN